MGDHKTLDHVEEGTAGMAQVTLGAHHILREINTLEPEELLEGAAGSATSTCPSRLLRLKRRGCSRRCSRSVYLTEIKPRRTDRQGVYPLVPIQGKPLSETIREERRGWSSASWRPARLPSVMSRREGLRVVSRASRSGHGFFDRYCPRHCYRDDCRHHSA